MRNKKIIQIIILLIVFHMINVFFFFKSGVWPQGKDWYWHLNNTFKMLNNLEHQFSLQNLVDVDIAYAPLYYWTGIILVKIFFSNNALFFNSSLFLFVLIFTIYAIGAQVVDRKVGLLAAIICSFFPAIYAKSIQYNLTLANITLVALCAYGLLRSNNFQVRKYSILSGIFLGLSLLVRQSAMLFLIGPILVTMLNFDSYKTEQYERKMINAIIFFGISILIALVFYNSVEKIQNMLDRTQHIAKVSDRNIFSCVHMTFYIKILSKQIGLINVILFLAGIYVCLKSKIKHFYFLTGWIIIPIVVLSFIRVKEFEFSMPFLPVIAICIAVCYNEISKKVGGQFLVLILITISMCQYFANFGIIR